MRIAVLGGGPGGLLAAMLAKSSDPAREVTVFERNRASDTFGFGVVFSDSTLAGIDDADPVLHSALTEHGVHWDTIGVHLKGERFSCSGNGMAAVERRTLLQLLQRRADEVDVELRFSTQVEPDDLIGDGFDLVIGADGANSQLREQYADVFEPMVETATAKFIWLGTTYPFDGLTFVHERSEHGVFAVHGYPIGGGVSTFIVETAEQSWRRAGLDEFDVAQPAGASDDRSRQYLEQLFAQQLEGHRLLVNNSRWANFRTRSMLRWHHRVGTTAIAMLGDSAHTAHFSVGSGTKMAMEDAVALVAGLNANTNVDGALAVYQEARKPLVAKIQGSARPSLSWWEHFGRSYEALAPWQFAYHFFTRALTDGRLRRRDPNFVANTEARWIAEHGASPLASPLATAGNVFPTRVVEVADEYVRTGEGDLRVGGEPTADGRWALRVDAPAAEADLPAALERVAKGVAAGAALVAVYGGTPLTRRLLCEEARFGCNAIALNVFDALDPDVATTEVLSGRADLVGVPSRGRS